MANAYKVTIKGITTDGTNLFVEVSIFDGVHTMPSIFPVFPVGTSAAIISAYVQSIADSQPTLAGGIADLVNTTVTGA